MWWSRLAYRVGVSDHECLSALLQDQYIDFLALGCTRRTPEGRGEGVGSAFRARQIHRSNDMGSGAASGLWR